MKRLFNTYPYQNLNDLNLDYVLKVAQETAAALAEIQDFTEQLDKLEEIIAKLESGEVPAPMMETIITELQNNLISVIGEMVKFVFFGVNDEGYFVAYVPEQWDGIVFNTTNYDIIIPNVDEIGRLVISY